MPPAIRGEARSDRAGCNGLGRPTLAVWLVAFALLACGTDSRPRNDVGNESGLEVVSAAEGPVPGWNLSWVRTVSGPENIGINSCIMNEDDSAIVAGWFDWYGVFAPETSSPIPIASKGSIGILLARVDAMGNPVWVRTVGGEALDQAAGIAADPDNHFYVVGSISYGPVFGAGEPNETNLPMLGKHDSYLARYDLDGNLDWVVSAGGESMFAIGLAVAMLDDGSILTGGLFYPSSFPNSGSIAFGHGTAEEVTVESAGDVGSYIARYGPDGRLHWAVPGCAGKNGGGFVCSLAADGDTFVVHGVFVDQATCSGTGDIEVDVASGGGIVPYLARYDADGRLLWARGLDVEDAPTFDVVMSEYTSSRSITILENGDIAVGGRYYGTMQVGLEDEFEPVTGHAPGGMIYLGRFDPQGNPLWVTTVSGGSNQDHGIGKILELDDGTIAMAGTFVAPSVFGKGEPNEIRFEPSWGTNGFLALYRDTGHLEWVIPQTNTHVWGIASRQNTILLTGNFWSTAIFGTGGLDKVFLKSSGSNDAFIMRLDRTGIPIDPG